MSFKFDISDKDRASARFIGNVHRSLAAEIARAGREDGLTQKQISDKLETNKSKISRLISGRTNITLRTIAEICWAIGLEPKMVLSKIAENGDLNESSKLVDLRHRMPSRTQTQGGSYLGGNFQIQPQITNDVLEEM